MTFAIFDLSEFNTREQLVWLENNIEGATRLFNQEDTNPDPILQGLSSGEMRQSLVDYVREDFKKKDTTNLMNTIRDIGEFSGSISPAELSTLNMDEKKVEDFLYQSTDCELEGLWKFSEKTLYVKEL